VVSEVFRLFVISRSDGRPVSHRWFRSRKTAKRVSWGSVLAPPQGADHGRLDDFVAGIFQSRHSHLTDQRIIFYN
jgi:hypothetical protein